MSIKILYGNTNAPQEQPTMTLTNLDVGDVFVLPITRTLFVKLTKNEHNLQDPRLKGQAFCFALQLTDIDGCTLREPILSHFLFTQPVILQPRNISITIGALFGH